MRNEESLFLSLCKELLNTYGIIDAPILAAEYRIASYFLKSLRSSLYTVALVLTIPLYKRLETIHQYSS